MMILTLEPEEAKMLLQLMNQASFQGGILETALTLKKKIEAAQAPAPPPKPIQRKKGDTP
jgi:hypothetical protein